MTQADQPIEGIVIVTNACSVRINHSRAIAGVVVSIGGNLPISAGNLGKPVDHVKAIRGLAGWSQEGLTVSIQIVSIRQAGSISVIHLRGLIPQSINERRSAATIGAPLKINGWDIGVILNPFIINGTAQLTSRRMLK